MLFKITIKTTKLKWNCEVPLFKLLLMWVLKPNWVNQIDMQCLKCVHSTVFSKKQETLLGKKSTKSTKSVKTTTNVVRQKIYKRHWNVIAWRKCVSFITQFLEFSAHITAFVAANASVHPHLVSRPRQSQGLLYKYKHLCHSLIN